jgi:hypothetical protein
VEANEAGIDIKPMSGERECCGLANRIHPPQGASGEIRTQPKLSFDLARAKSLPFLALDDHRRKAPGASSCGRGKSVLQKVARQRESTFVRASY